jgi:SpoVK/Ycf46/Vps4 family AAA+-type ATPase
VNALSSLNAHQASDKNAQQWTVMPGGSYRPCGRTIERLPPGAYACSQDPYGNLVLQRRTLHVDNLVDFPGSLPWQILQEITRFWTMGERFHKYGYLHRRGYLLHGKQGCGKSSLIHQVIHHSVAQGNVALFCEAPPLFIACVEQFRVVEPDRPILGIFEDIDAIISRYGSAVLLQWLDGNCQVDKAVSIATTNFPERLDRRITSRPRRFDRMLRIDSPDARVRDAYFAHKLSDLSCEHRRHWTNLTDGLTFAALAELIISVCCLGNDLEESVALLKQLDRHETKSDDYDEGDDDDSEQDDGECE